MATITVNTTIDEADGSIIDGDISLRDAIAAASAGDRILFDASVFTADNDPLNNTAIGLTLGTLFLSQDVTIVGDTNGDGIADVEINGAGNGGYRMFNVNSSGVSAAFEALTFADAYSSTGSGGAIRSVSGSTVSVLNSTFSNNYSNNFGGAIRNYGDMTIANSTFTGNEAEIGGAIRSSSGDLTVLNSTFTGNLASLSGFSGAGGGAIQIASGTLTLINSTLTGNRAAQDGGGLDITGGTATVENTIIAGNSAGVGNSEVDGTIASNGANIFGGAVTGSAGGDVVLTGGPGNALTDVFDSVGSFTVGGATFDAGTLASNGGPTQTVAITATAWR